MNFRHLRRLVLFLLSPLVASAALASPVPQLMREARFQQPQPHSDEVQRSRSSQPEPGHSDGCVSRDSAAPLREDARPAKLGGWRLLIGAALT